MALLFRKTPLAQYKFYLPFPLVFDVEVQLVHAHFSLMFLCPVILFPVTGKAECLDKMSSIKLIAFCSIFLYSLLQLNGDFFYNDRSYG